MLRWFLQRFFRRVRHAFRWRELWTWKYESCNRCGSTYRLPTGWYDEVWIRVNGRKEGCLCIDCFLTQAQKKRIGISIKSFERLWVFDPEGGSGGCFDILKPKEEESNEAKNAGG